MIIDYYTCQLRYNPYTGRYEYDVADCKPLDFSGMKWNPYTGQYEITSKWVTSEMKLDEEEELKQKLQNLKVQKAINEQVKLGKEKDERVRKLKEEIAALEKELGISEKAKNQADPCKG